MEKITFNLTQLHKHGTAFFEYLALRKQFFVDQLGWDIPHDDDLEMDQYDNPQAYYSLVLQDGKVIGGGRAMATTARWGSHTYMLRDAVEGKIIGIPDTIVDQVLITANVWECTRVVVSSEIKDPAASAECLSLIVDGLADQARQSGATEMMALSRPSLVRALRKIGYAPQMIGESYVNSDDGRRYVAMTMSVNDRIAPTRQITPRRPVDAKSAPVFAASPL
ncbi:MULTISPECIES: acyl-homoserine-lactone synthase [unclassified Yoonia]|uniref:acyl-homoserine-lactone synthase n=1 Tax=unclassified Yoonia TaxID=2629118 RepID=UPI002AFFFD9B|nr:MULTISPECIES: acyl-homoserine-lactone synthase [unclassified Yoonia]